MIATSLGLCKNLEMKILNLVLKAFMFGPIAFWIIKALDGSLGADPAKELNHLTGLWGLYYLLINLSIGLLVWAYRILEVKPSMLLKLAQQQRRWLGVVGFLFIFIHLGFYFLMEGFDLTAIQQIISKNYLIFGLLSLILLSALAITSNDWSVRRFGGRKWKNLHRLVYLAYALSLFHFFQIEKADIDWFLKINLPIMVLLIGRAVFNFYRYKKKSSKAAIHSL